MPDQRLWFPAVFDAELEKVTARRANVGGNAAGEGTRKLVRFAEDERWNRTGAYDPPRPVDEAWLSRWPLERDGKTEGGSPRDTPAASDLVGLALSGGGIRSAATCLGAMQALDAKGVMRLVDYMSSVSGGGYAAACLNANIVGVLEPTKAAAPAAPSMAQREAVVQAPTKGAVRKPPSPGWFFPFPHAIGIRETVLFRYLRANAQYLFPRGRVREYSFAPVLLLRGLFLNLWAMLPLVLLASAITLLLLACPRLRDVARAGEMLGIVALVLAVYWAIFFVFSFQMRRSMEANQGGRAWGLLLALTIGIGVVLARYDRVVGGVALAIVAVVGLLEIWRRDAYAARAARRRAGGARKTVEDIKAVAGLTRESFRQAQAQALLVTLALLFLAFQPVAANWVGAALAEDRISWGTATTLAGVITGSAWLGRFEKLPERIRKALMLLAAALVGPVLLWGGSLLIAAVIALNGGVWTNEELGLWWQLRHVGPVKVWLVTHGATGLAVLYVWVLVFVAGVLWLANLYLYNANDVSPHVHYRDKLASTFQFSADLANRDAVTSRSELLLSGMDVTTAPFPLVNAALNFADRDEYRGRGRNSTFFTFSPLHVGSTEVGFVPTRALEAIHPAFKLSSAIAVSAAAASANMGRNTNAAFRFLMSLVNVRLGYWLPNPRVVARGQWDAASYPQPDAAYLLREMVGALDTWGPLVNLSDGGHLENLGVYELIRRRCRVIIAIDAEKDSDMAFRALGDVVRFARIDRAVNIEIDVGDIRPGDKKLSKRHYAVGRIDYGRGDHGWLIYIKNSLTGREGTSIDKYKAIETDFPHHDTTGDQFFDEEQFEAYRELGYHMVTEAFARWR